MRKKNKIFHVHHGFGFFFSPENHITIPIISTMYNNLYAFITNKMKERVRVDKKEYGFRNIVLKVLFDE